VQLPRKVAVDKHCDKVEQLGKGPLEIGLIGIPYLQLTQICVPNKVHVVAEQQPEGPAGMAQSTWLCPASIVFYYPIFVNAIVWCREMDVCSGNRMEGGVTGEKLVL
jgi:hypothetical protein